MYRLGILTSLYDDYAVELLERIDQAVAEGFIQAEIPFVLCNRGRGFSAEVDRRIAAVERLKHAGELITFSSRDFEPELRAQDRERWRLLHDREVLEILPKADSYLNVGYMQLIGAEMIARLDIVNLHPALPWLGPVGIWPKVMEEQAERPLPYLSAIKQEELREALPKIMEISWNRAGGMLHLVSEEPDRGPVLSWYELSLTSPRLNELWLRAAEVLHHESLEAFKGTELWQKLVGEIRQEQFKGEEPLILLTYRKLSLGEWEIKDRRLWIGGRELPGGYCLNREIGEYLKDQGVESLIQ
jgi:folate-dependent phosphoribosylglycinamide formyltransferase PurN